VSNRLLATYLNDHLAGAVAAGELARRCARSNRDSPLGRALTRLADELDEDRGALQSIMGRLGVGGDPVKLTAAWAAEKLGRLKLNGRIIGYSRLSRLEELEVLMLGVEGKLLLWEALARTDHPALREVDMKRLIERARSQRRRLKRHRLEAAEAALARQDAR
jgi:hypothetical protein